MADMFAPLVAQLKANPKTIVFTEGNDPRILEAASKLLAEGVLKVVMVGNEAECKAAAAAGNFDISAAEIIDPENYAGFDEMVSTRSFVAPDFLKTSRHTSQQKGGQRRSFSKRFLIQAPVIIMKIIDSHLHFCPGYPHFDEIAIEAGHINNEEHLRECFQKYNIVGGIVMGNRGVHPDNHTYPDFLRYCVGVEARKLTPEKIQKTCDLVEENLKRNTCVGIKLYPGYDSIYVTDELRRAAAIRASRSF